MTPAEPLTYDPGAPGRQGSHATLNKETIRRLDAFVGRAICLLLTLHRRARDRLLPRTPPPSPERVVFIKLIEQGATVLAGTAVRRAVERVGRDRVYFCVFEENRPILDLLDLVPAANVFVLRNRSLGAFARDAWRALAAMRRAGVDAAVDLEFMTRAPAILAYLSGATRRVGLHRYNAEAPYRGDLLTHRVQYNPFQHTAQAYASLVAALDCDPADVPLPKVAPPPVDPPRRFVPGDDEVARARALLEELAGGPVTGRVVVINPNTGDLIPLRMWPADRFAELGRRLVAAYPDVLVVVTGLASEREGAEAVCRAIGSGRAVCVAGRTSLREVVVLYTLSDVLVASDSGPGHFGSLTDVDAVVLFGPEAPQLFAPIGPRTHVLWAGLACSPCVSPYNHRFSPCTRNACMDAITVDQVFAAVSARLDARRPPGAPAAGGAP